MRELIGETAERVFSWAGKNVQTILIVAAVTLSAGAAFGAWKLVDDYLDRNRQTEADLNAALDAAGELRGQVDSLGRAIDINRKAYEAERAQIEAARLIAEQERDAALARVAAYERIRDAARDAPPSDYGPVDPVVRDTVDRLWPDPAA
jgi:hypothetical protein